MIYSLRSVLNLVLWVLILVSISFGLVKQGKTAIQSAAHYQVIQKDRGASIRSLREKLLKKMPPATLGDSQFAYLTDRIDGPGLRPAREFYYDAQYAFAPYGLGFQEAEADFYIIDYTSPQEAQMVLTRHSLRTLAEEDGVLLATRDRGIL